MQKQSKILISVFLLIGIVYTVIAASFVAANISTRHNYMPVKAEITAFNGNDKNKETVVKYLVDGTEYEASLNSYSSTWKVGSKIDIYCNPQNFAQAKIIMPVGMNILFGSFGVIFIIVAVVLVIKNSKILKRKKYLLSEGLVLSAEIIDFYENNRIAVNNRHPYIVVAEYDDGVQCHRFKSDNVWERLSVDILGMPVKVYYENGNMNHYYVDTESLKDSLHYSVDKNIIYH